MEKTKIAINGALGRMGRRITDIISNDPTLKITGAIDVVPEFLGKDLGVVTGFSVNGVNITDNLDEAVDSADVLIDFTNPESTLKSSEICSIKKKPIVVGTTGFSKEKKEIFLKNVENIPCVFAPNMSVGVNLLFKLVAEAAKVLKEDYDIEIMEVHHRFKKDAPSGTALRLAEIIAENLNRDLEKTAVYGRQGIIGERKKDEIGIMSLRSGDVIGEHTVTFGTIGERIELIHKAHSRDALAKGAVYAAKFIADANPGLYDMQDVLGLK